MQIPIPVSSSGQSSMFDVILAECSINQIQLQRPEQIEELPLPHQQLFQQKEDTFNEHLFWLDQASYDNLHEELEEKLDLNLEFKRVKSLREEQETKITQFLREDKFKSLRSIDIPDKSDSPLSKYSQSLSPRKRKRIDKNKTIKPISEDD